MKIKKLLLLGLMAVCSMNVFAADYKVSGINYTITGTAPNLTATVKSISSGMADATTLTIPASFTDGDGNTVKVTGFTTGWETAEQNVSAKTKNISVDVTNIGSVPANSFAGLTILEKVTLTGTHAAADVTVNALSSTTPATTFKTLDLSGLAGKAKVTIAAVDVTIETITLPTQATVIGANAFKNSNLKGIDLTNVTEIGANAFDGCASADFKSLTIPANIAKGKIGAKAFQNMTNLESVTINNNNLEKVEAWFASDSKIKTIAITSTSITEIEANAFSGVSATDFKTLDLTGCSKLKTVATSSFPANAYEKVLLKGTAIDDANLTNVKSWLTGASASLTELTLPDGITTFPSLGTFTKLESVGLPKNITSIATGACQNWTALKAIKIKSHITSIGNNAFDGCTALIRADFSDATELTTIGANAFDNTKITTLDLTACAKLQNITSTSFPANAYTSVLLAGSGLVYTTTGGTYVDGFSAPFATILSGATASLEEITLPTQLEVVQPNQFAGFTKLTAISLPKAVKEIGSNAFNGSGLTSIKIRENVETIDPFAFANCADLATVNFSEAANLTTIDVMAFDSDPKLLSIDLSGAAKLATIYANSFDPANAYTSVLLNGSALAGLAVADDPTTYYDNFSTNFATILSGSKKSLTEITLPAGLQSIGAGQFQNFSALTSVGLPKGVKSIGNSAFEASGLTAFKVRENVTAIGAAAFKDCAALETVNFSEATALTTIGGSAFRNTAIKEAILPANVKTMIGGFQFADCKKLKSFSAKGLVGDVPNNIFQNDVKLTGIVIPTGATGIGAGAFLNCSSLATVTFKFGANDDALATNGIGANAFEGCAALTALDLSTTQLTALDQADIFLGCTALAEITFPETLVALGDGMGTADGLFAACPIETLDASNVILSDILFGMYYDAKTNSNIARDKKHTNTTLKTVKIGGEVPTNCFAYCTALESVEYFAQSSPAWSDVDAYAFDNCTGLATFTFNPEAAVTTKIVDDQAFHGCVPFVKFVTNGYYMDYLATYNDGIPPLNTSYGEAGVTKIQTVQDKKNPNQCFAKFYHTTRVIFDAEDCKVFTAYVDGETVYYQACRTYDGYYQIPARRPVIIKTSEPQEVSYELGGWQNSLGWNDLYCAQEGEALVDVQDHMHPQYNASPVWYAGMSAGEYLYRLTNTDDQGFGFTFFSGTNIKAGQFFLACEKKPEGAGRLNEVWLDEDGNVIEGEATAIQNIEKAAEQNNGAIYNLQGVRVQKAQKGLYIQNGKKIFVK